MFHVLDISVIENIWQYFRPPDDVLPYSCNLSEDDHNHSPHNHLCNCCCSRHSFSSPAFLSYLTQVWYLILIITENNSVNAGGEDDTERTETTDKEAEGEGWGWGCYLWLEVRRHGDWQVLFDWSHPLHCPHHGHHVRLSSSSHRNLEY